MNMISNKKILELQKKSIKLRISMIKMSKDSGSGMHMGGGLSVMDILTALYFYVLNVDPKNPNWEERDRFILSAGHKCCALCSILAEKGYFKKQLLETFNLLDSPFGMHPDMHKILGCDMSTGSLGMGFTTSVGMALAAKYLNKKNRVYVVLGDGEMGEGCIWESIRIASQYKLDNLCGIIDRNKYSVDGPTDGPGFFKCIEKGVEGTTSLEPLDKKIEAFGWNVISCNGHDLKELLNAFEDVKKEKVRPSMIIANTFKGKGISFTEDKYEWHYGAFSEEQFKKAFDELDNQLKSLN